MLCNQLHYEQAKTNQNSLVDQAGVKRRHYKHKYGLLRADCPFKGILIRFENPTVRLLTPN